MTTSARAEPWRSLPADVADAIAPELPGITEDILDSIAAEVPEYARPLEGSFGRGVRTGVPVARADLEPAAALAAWSLPRSAAALACNEGDLGRIARRLPADVLAAPHQGAGCVVIPDPGGPGRGTAIAAAADGLGAALGPSGQVAKLAASWSLARAALRAADAAGAAPTELVMVEDRLAEVL